MYAYCRNEPVFRRDSLGTEDVSVDNTENDDNPLNDLGKSPSGGSSGRVPVKSFGSPTSVNNANINKNIFPDKGIPNSSKLCYASDGTIKSAGTYGSDGTLCAQVHLRGHTHYVKSIRKPLLMHVHPMQNNNGHLNKKGAITIDEYLGWWE